MSENVEIRSAALSKIKDPFGSDFITDVWISASKSAWDNKWGYDANVTFKNGSTKGEQHFEAKSFIGVIKEVEKFIKGLEESK